MAAENVGTAYVLIRALTNQIASDIKDGLAKGVADAGVEDEGRSIGDSLADGTTSEYGERLDADLPDITRDSAERTAKSSDTDRGGRSIGSRLFSSMVKAWKDEDKKGTFNNAFQKTIDGLQKIKMPGGLWGWLAISAPGAAVGALQLVTFYLTGIVAQLGYIATAAVGAGGALIGFVGGLLPAVGVLFAAFKAQTEELEAFKEAATDAFAPWEQVAKATQAGLFPGLLDALEKIQDLIPMFTTFGTVIGEITGEFARLAADTLTTEENMSALESVLGSSSELWATVLDIVLQLLDSMPELFEATAPLAQRLADSLLNMATHFNEFITRTSQSGELASTLSDWYNRFATIAEIVGNLAQAIWNVLQIGGDASAPMFENFNELTRKWLEFTESTAGQNRIKEIFDEALPVMQRVNDIIGDIFELIAKPLLESDNAGMMQFLDMIQYDVIPALADLSEILINSGSGALQDLADALANFLQTLADNPEVAEGILKILSSNLWLFTAALDGLSAVIGSDFGSRVLPPLLSLFFVLKLWGTLEAIPILGVLVKFARTSVFTVIAAGARALASAIFTQLIPAFAGLTIAGAPVWVVLLAIAAAAGIFYLAFKYWDKIPGWVKLVVMIFVPFIGTMFQVIWVIKNWDKIASVFVAAWDKIFEVARTAVNKVKGFVTGVARWFGELATKVWDKITEFSTKLADWIKGLPDKIKRFFTETLPALIQAMVSWVVQSGPELAKQLGYWALRISVWAALMPVILTIALARAGIALVQWLWDAIPAAAEAIGEWAGSIWEKVSTFVSELPGKIFGAAQAIVSWFVRANQLAGQKMTEWITSIWNKITTFIRELPGRILGAADAIWTWVSSAVGKAWSKMQEIFNAVWGQISAFITSIPGKIAGAADAVWSWVSTAASNAATKMASFFSAIVREFHEFLVNLPSKIRQWINNLDDLGGDIVDAILEGIKEAWNDIVNWIKTSGKNFIQGAIDYITPDIPSWVPIVGKSSAPAPPQGSGGGAFSASSFSNPVFSTAAASITPLMAPAVSPLSTSMLRGAVGPTGFAMAEPTASLIDALSPGSGRSTLGRRRLALEWPEAAPQQPTETTLVNIENAVFTDPVDVDILMNKVRLAYQVFS